MPYRIEPPALDRPGPVNVLVRDPPNGTGAPVIACTRRDGASGYFWFSESSGQNFVPCTVAWRARPALVNW